MTVVGVDRGLYLHIRLYFKFGRSEYFCLNDTLFEKKFAEINRSVPSSDSVDVGMRGYINEYQRLRQALQNLATAFHKGSGSTSPSGTSRAVP